MRTATRSVVAPRRCSSLSFRLLISSSCVHTRRELDIPQHSSNEPLNLSANWFKRISSPHPLGRRSFASVQDRNPVVVPHQKATDEQISYRRQEKEIQYQLGLLHEQKEGGEVTHDLAKAVQFYTKAAEDERTFADEKEKEMVPGHTLAKYRLALILLEGREGIVERDTTKALSLLEAAAERGSHGESYYQLALCYLYGVGVRRNPARGYELLHTAALKDVPNALYLRGRMLLYGEEGEGKQDVTMALSFLKRAAYMGIPAAHYLIGQIYHYGLGPMEKDMHRAIEHYDSAAKAGDADALYTLASLHLTGEEDILPTDIHSAFELFLTAAKSDHIEAMVAVGTMYELGEGTEKNEEEAIRWYEKAAERGDISGQLRLGHLHKEREAYGKAAEYYGMAADQDSGEAACHLAMLYVSTRLGRDLGKKGIDKAIRLLHKAIELSYPMAYVHIASLYAKGITTLGGVILLPKDMPKAIEYLQRAVERHQLPEAQCMLAELLLEEGEGGGTMATTDTIERAKELLTASASKGFAPAQHKLLSLGEKTLG